MKRYDMGMDRQGVQVVPVEEEDGAWVRHDDVKEILEFNKSFQADIKDKNDLLKKIKDLIKPMCSYFDKKEKGAYISQKALTATFSSQYKLKKLLRGEK